jgi:predicted ATPase
MGGHRRPGPHPHPGRRVRAPGSRLDRLDVEERAVLERASVVGQVFDRQAVVALSPETARPAVGPRLAMLVRRQLIHAEAAEGTADGDAVTAGLERFRFRHLLIRGRDLRGTAQTPPR